jgi:hypothetical protein
LFDRGDLGDYDGDHSGGISLFAHCWRSGLAKIRNKWTASINLSKSLSYRRFGISPKNGVLILHHLKKNQSDPTKAAKLRENLVECMDRIYGSQARLAHVETIVGWEQDSKESIHLGNDSTVVGSAYLGG